MVGTATNTSVAAIIFLCLIYFWHIQLGLQCVHVVFTMDGARLDLQKKEPGEDVVLVVSTRSRVLGLSYIGYGGSGTKCIVFFTFQ